MKIKLGGGGPSNTSRNIGDIFYTTRTDNSLNGAVECNGSQYNFSDFDSNLQALFDEGKLPYLPISEFDEMVTNQGGCDSFGYNETNLYAWTNFYTGTKYTKKLDFVDGEEVHLYYADMSEYKPHSTIKYIASTNKINIYPFEPVSSVDLSRYSEEDILLTSSFKVPKKLGRVLVRSQKPKASNNYTWYNVYADGWVEQGGIYKMTALNYAVYDLVIQMLDPNYNLVATFNDLNASDADLRPVMTGGYTATTFKAKATEAGTNSYFNWQVSGYADSTEYTKDKWNYQNIQVERCMVQLFNSTTDTAVATCNQVLSDISTLNQGDYVVYWDSYEISDHSHAYTGITLDEYQWYRIYKSGWVEQAGFGSGADWKNISVSLPIEMIDVNYTPIITTIRNVDPNSIDGINEVRTISTTGFVASSGVGDSTTISWQVSGFSFLA